MDPTGNATIDHMKKIVGDPRNYGPSPEEKAEAERKRQEEQVS